MCGMEGEEAVWWRVWREVERCSLSEDVVSYRVSLLSVVLSDVWWRLTWREVEEKMITHIVPCNTSRLLIPGPTLSYACVWTISS